MKKERRERLNGERFGRLVVLGFSHIGPSGNCCWHCLCDCGNRAIVAAYGLKKNSKSCGCRQRDIAHASNLGHGRPLGDPNHKTRTYRIWRGMLARCNNPKASGYHVYGGKGIRVCARWASSFNAFLSDMGHVTNGKSIDRIDSDKDYEPTNCRWATWAEQTRNSKRNHWIEWNGQRKILSDWAFDAGINPSTLRTRLVLGWPMAKATNL